MSQVKQRKVALMGFRSVGKSSLAIQFVQGQFVDAYDPTIENTFNKTLKVRNQDFELFVVDTGSGRVQHLPNPVRGGYPRLRPRLLHRQPQEFRDHPDSV